MSLIPSDFVRSYSRSGFLKKQKPAETGLQYEFFNKYILIHEVF